MYINVNNIYNIASASNLSVNHFCSYEKWMGWDEIVQGFNHLLLLLSMLEVRYKGLPSL